MHKGSVHFVTKMFFQPSDLDLPFTLKWFQFRIRLAYSMTINKSQGQTFNKVCVYLNRACFSHGQLYVAFSRGRSFDGLKIALKSDTNQGKHNNKWHTQNVVFQSVLDHCKIRQANHWKKCFKVTFSRVFVRLTS